LQPNSNQIQSVVGHSLFQKIFNFLHLSCLTSIFIYGLHPWQCWSRFSTQVWVSDALYFANYLILKSEVNSNLTHKNISELQNKSYFIHNGPVSLVLHPKYILIIKEKINFFLCFCIPEHLGPSPRILRNASWIISINPK